MRRFPLTKKAPDVRWILQRSARSSRGPSSSLTKPKGPQVAVTFRPMARRSIAWAKSCDCFRSSIKSRGEGQAPSYSPWRREYTCLDVDKGVDARGAFETAEERRPGTDLYPGRPRGGSSRRSEVSRLFAFAG